MPRVILQPYSYEDESFPENPALPEGVREVRWQDSFGYGVAFKPDIVYAERDGERLTISYLTPRNDRRDNPLIVFVQGSAWFRQDIYIHLPELLRMCQRGYCAVPPVHHGEIPRPDRGREIRHPLSACQCGEVSLRPGARGHLGRLQRRTHRADGGLHGQRLPER